MTNKQDPDEEEPSRNSDPRTAALTAVHIVGQVLDEAYDIANAAQDSGQPWRYLSMLKKINNKDISCVRDEVESLESSKGDSVKENDIEVVANIVATSTPQKNLARQIDCSDELNELNDSTLIGQGDQGIEENDNTLTNSTSMFINNLFDMSELERVIICDDENKNTQGTSESDNLLSDEAYTKFMENYVNYLFPPKEDKPAIVSTFNPFLSSILTEENIDENVGEPHRYQSEYLFLDDAPVADIGRDVGFYIEEDSLAERDRIYVSLETDMVQKNEIYEGIRHITTVEEVYEGLRSAIVDKDYENQKTSESENYKDLRTASEVNNIFTDLQSTMIEENHVMNNNEVYKGLRVPSVEIVNECQLTAMFKEDYKTQNTDIADNSVCESQETATVVEISKNLRTATIEMEVYEGLRTATDIKQVYEGVRTTVIKDEHDSQQTATIEKEIREGLRSSTVGKTYESPWTDEELKQEADDVEKEAIKQKNDFELYENAYMTLNRDYDQNSEDDGFPILQDPKEMVLQEVELMTHPSEEDLQLEKAVPNEKDDTITTSGISLKSKSTLARRCRLQGARIFACIRGWWRRKTPGKRKDMRKASLGVCPLSPEARRRSSSLLDSRHLRSPSPSRPAMWKFNTVNETLVNSNRWKEYTFDVMAEGSEQF